jgi:hypothetical protein
MPKCKQITSNATHKMPEATQNAKTQTNTSNATHSAKNTKQERQTRQQCKKPYKFIMPKHTKFDPANACTKSVYRTKHKNLRSKVKHKIYSPNATLNKSAPLNSSVVEPQVFCTVPVPVPVPTLEKLRFQFRFQVHF